MYSDIIPGLFLFLIEIMVVLLVCFFYCDNRKSILSVVDFFVHLFSSGHYTPVHEREREWSRSKNGF